MSGNLTLGLLANEKSMSRKLTSYLRRSRVQTGAKRPKAKRSDANLDLEEVKHQNKTELLRLLHFLNSPATKKGRRPVYLFSVVTILLLFKLNITLSTEILSLRSRVSLLVQIY